MTTSRAVSSTPTTFIPQTLPQGTPLQLPTVVFSADGAITLTAGGVAILSKSSAGAYTLAAPTGANGAILILTASTAQAHVVTIPTAAAGGGAGQDVGTFGGAINDSTVLVSYNSLWFVVSTRNVTWA
jgi:hypothetical protein